MFQARTHDLPQIGFVQLIVAAAGHADGAGRVDLRHKAGEGSFIVPGAEEITRALLQGSLQLCFGVLLQGGAGAKIYAGKHSQQHGGDHQHGGGNHFPAKFADHSSTSRQ